MCITCGCGGKGATIEDLDQSGQHIYPFQHSEHKHSHEHTHPHDQTSEKGHVQTSSTTQHSKNK